MVIEFVMKRTIKSISVCFLRLGSARKAIMQATFAPVAAF
jgi:hypothetical protein